MAGIYLHIPFCKRICAYCDFFRSADLRLMNPLSEALHRELDNRSNYLHDREIHTIYFGGGTPSLYSPPTLQGLIDHARTIFEFGPLDEVTIECNPDDLTNDYLAQLRNTQINRLSIGIQSFNDACLGWMNRRHTAAEAIDAVKRAQKSGFKNITIDLIFGIPGFGEEILHQTLETALSLDVQHISAYHLTIEPQTALGRGVERGEFTPVSEQVSEHEFAVVDKMLTEGGFEHYEVSNFAKPGHRAKHNSAYWNGTEYLGIGPGAHSFCGSERRWCDSSAKEYIESPNYQSEELTDCDRRNECIMTSLRTSDGINLEGFEGRFGVEARRKLLDSAAPFINDGTLRFTGERLHMPPEKFLISDSVICSLFEV